MKRRISRAVLALLAGLGLSQMVAEPVSASFIAGNESVISGQLWNRGHTISYCGGGHSQIGIGADRARGSAFTQAGLWWTYCSLGTAFVAPPEWLIVAATMLRNGSACASTSLIYNSRSTYAHGITVGPCSNGAGWQEWQTLGDHYILSDTGGYYVQGFTLSPWQLY
jgi:hypothetical protein